MRRWKKAKRERTRGCRYSGHSIWYFSLYIADSWNCSASRALIYRPAGPLSCPRGSELSFAYSHGTMPLSLFLLPSFPFPIAVLFPLLFVRDSIRVAHFSSLYLLPSFLRTVLFTPLYPPFPNYRRLPVNLFGGTFALFRLQFEMQPGGCVLRTDFSPRVFSARLLLQSILSTFTSRHFCLLVFPSSRYLSARSIWCHDNVL